MTTESTAGRAIFAERDVLAAVAEGNEARATVNVTHNHAPTVPPWHPKIPPLPVITKQVEADRFKFTAALTAFLGRDEEMAQLRAFLTESEKFRWWLMAGPGGIGKSRLALEICRAPAAGPAWHCGFLLLDEEQRQIDAAKLAACVAPWEHWQPDQPTLIVVDYVVERAAFLGMVVRSLAMRTDLLHPLRFLLLEREAEGQQWRQAFNAADSIGQSFMGETQHAAPLVLATPGDDALWSIITLMAQGKAGDRTDLLGQLREIDPQCRPLFAAFLGDSIAHAEQPRRWDRLALLKDVLNRDKTHFWTKGGVTGEDETLLCLATLTSGAFASWLEPSAGQTVGFPAALPRLDDADLERRYQVMTGSPILRSDDPLQPHSVFPPLQPDLLGEFFVLQHLTAKGLPENWGPKLRDWLNAVWQFNPLGTAMFLDRLGADFHDDRAMPCFFAAPNSNKPLIQQIWAMVVVNRGVTLGQLGRSEEEIAVYDDLLARFGSASEAGLREQVAKALFNKGVVLGELGRSEEEIAVYDDLLARFGSASEAGLRVQVAQALANKGITLGDLGCSKEAIAAYDDLLARFGSASEAGLREPVAKALLNKGNTLGQLGRSEGAIAVYDDLLARFGSASEAGLREPVAKALLNKGNTLGQLERSEEAIAVYDDLLARFGSASEAGLRERVAQVLVNKGITLGDLGRSEEAIAVYDDLLDRFGSVSEAGLRERVAKALFNKGNTLGDLGCSEEAIAVYDDLLARFGSASEAGLREPVAKALFNKGGRLGQLGRSEEEIAAFHEIVQRFAKADEPELAEVVARVRTVLDSIQER